MFVMIRSAFYFLYDDSILSLQGGGWSYSRKEKKQRKYCKTVNIFMQQNINQLQEIDQTLQQRCICTSSFAHTGLCRFRRPNAWAPTLVGTKLLCPSPPDRLRKSAKRWVTQVAVLHPRFCVVALLKITKGEKHTQ